MKVRIINYRILLCDVAVSLLPVIGEVTRRRQKMSKRRDVLQHIDEVEENDPNSEKSTTGINAQLTQRVQLLGNVYEKFNNS